MEEKSFNFIPVIGICVIILIVLIAIGSNSNNSGQFDCSDYQEELHKVANSPENLIETHKTTGVIKQVDINDKFYTVVINKDLWDKTTAEQRQLIRCSTTEVARSKGLEGGIIDPLRQERLY